MTAKPQAWEEGNPSYLAESQHPPKSEIKSVSNNRYCSSTSRITTPSQSENSGFLPKRQYYQPQDDEDTYYINSEGHLQCHQDSQTIIKAPTPQELPGSKEHPIFHKPGSIKISSVEDLLRLYPNSFDRLGSLKGEYDIKEDPNSATSTACEREGANRKQGSNRRGH